MNIQQKQILYKVSVSTNKMQVWFGWTNNEEVYCSYGQENGKLQEKVYSATPKNVGRSNETSAEEQAVVELQAMYQAQIDNKHYRLTKEEAVVLKNSNREPRKLLNYKDGWRKMPNTLLSSVKLNGSRACVIDGQLYSKIGRPEEIKVVHLKEAVEKLTSVGLGTFDAEVYAKGLSLQRIRSAWLKPVKTEKEINKIKKDYLKQTGKELPYDPNEDALKLKLYVFDIPDTTGMTFKDRVDQKMSTLIEFIYQNKLKDSIRTIVPFWTESHERRMEALKEVVTLGNEGLVHYDPKGVYEFGKRSSNAQKSKPRYDSEALVEKVTSDKSGEGVLHCAACDVLENVKFKCKMKVERRDGKRYERDFDTMKNLVGKWITFSYEELSDKGVPTKPVGEDERNCDNEGNPLE